ncbi:MAG: protein kinase [Nitrospirae bacterium]|nr:protein kinase [Fimbriimonadaceae bacterium]
MVGSILRIRYELTQALDEGPIFTTFLANDRQTAQQVSVRLFRSPYSEEPAFVEAVRKQVEIAKAAQHPGLERIFEVDVHDGQPYCVGDASLGTRLDVRIRKLAPFSVPLAVSTAVDLCEALAALHRLALVHGDVGAHNVVIRSDNALKLQMACIWEAYSESGTAGSAVLRQMTTYLAPEICAGQMPSRASDVYAVGILMFEMLTGKHPYVGETPVATAMKHASAPVPDVGLFNKTVPPVLSDLVRRCMAKDPQERPQDATELLAELRTFQDALRFGKPVAAPPARTAKPREEEGVAPRMTAARPERGRRNKELDVSDTGIPGFLKGAILFFAALILGMVAMFVVFNVKKPAQVKVPELRGMGLTEADETLKKIGLSLRVAQRETSEDVPRDHIIDMNPKPTQTVFEGAQINVRVSRGSQYVVVPDLANYRLEDARSLLATMDLELDAQVLRKPSDQPEGTILEQNPAPKARVERLSRIAVVVAGRQETAPPDRNAKFMHAVSFDLDDLEESVVVRVDLTDTRPTRTVYEERHSPGDRVRFEAEGVGSIGTLTVYYDGMLVMTETIHAKREEP